MTRFGSQRHSKNNNSVIAEEIKVDGSGIARSMSCKTFVPNAVHNVYITCSNF